jgi:hypothetical protein
LYRWTFGNCWSTKRLRFSRLFCAGRRAFASCCGFDGSRRRCPCGGAPGVRRSWLRSDWRTLRARPLRQLAVQQTQIAIADRDDVLAHHRPGVRVSLAVDADGGDVEGVARRLESAAEDVARHDRERCAGRGDRRDELAPRNASRGRLHRWIFFLFTHNVPFDTLSGRVPDGAHSHDRGVLVKRPAGRTASGWTKPGGAGSWKLELEAETRPPVSQVHLTTNSMRGNANFSATASMMLI